MIYCISRHAPGYGFIIAAMADEMNIFNRIIYGYGWSFDKYQLIYLAISFAMWLICIIAGSVIKGKTQILVVSVISMLTYWGICSLLYSDLYFDIDLIILASLTILSSLAMKQMDM